MRDASLGCQFLHARDKILAGFSVILPKLYFTFCLLNLRVLDLRLRGISRFGSSKAFFLAAQVFSERPELRVPAADLLGAQDKQFFARFYGLAFFDTNTTNYRLMGRLDRIRARSGY